MITITDNRFDPAHELRTFRSRTTESGAVVSFTGLVRPRSSEGLVQCLHLQAYPPLTEDSIKKAIIHASQLWQIDLVQVVHRIGDMVPGDAIVFVAVASKHRRAAFEAADYLMDYLKTEAVFWKKEIGELGSKWIEPRPRDYNDAKRWSRTAESDL